jgi:hypothetical protein
MPGLSVKRETIIGVRNREICSPPAERFGGINKGPSLYTRHMYNDDLLTANKGHTRTHTLY